MSLEKAIASGKEWRKPYYRAGRFDKTCRPHGNCPWCEGNRKHRDRKHAEAGRDALCEFFDGGY